MADRLSTDGDCDGEPAAVDRVLDLLSDPLCREVLGVLVGRSGEILDLDTLVDDVLEARPGDHAARRDAMTLRLHHAVLPKLAGARVVEFDPRRGVLRYTSDERLERWLDMVGGSPGGDRP